VVAVDGSQVRRDACADSLLVCLRLLQPYEVIGFRRMYTIVSQREDCCRYVLGFLPISLANCLLASAH
jgi:hypothetical protein